MSELKKKQARILVVDDDWDILRSVRHKLRREGYAVEMAETAHSALAHCAAGRPDLILLDILLPDGSGLNVCRQLRKTMGWDVPILIMSCRHDLDSRLAGLRAGAQGFLPKPFVLSELLEYVRVHLRVHRSRVHETH